MDKIAARNKVGGIQLEESLRGVLTADNLGIALVVYFEGHMDRPEDDPEIDEIGTSQWVADKVNAALDRIVDKLGIS